MGMGGSSTLFRKCCPLLLQTCAVLSPERGISKEGSSSLKAFWENYSCETDILKQGYILKLQNNNNKSDSLWRTPSRSYTVFHCSKKNWVLQRPFLSMAVTFQMTERWGFLTNLLQTTRTYLQPTKNNQTHKATSPCCFYCHIVAILVPQHSSNLLVGDTLHAPYRAF